MPRKAAIAVSVPVPQTDTGRKGEEPKAGGRSIVKELGKNYAKYRDKGYWRD